MKGWMGKILKINLSERKVEPIQIDDELKRKYVGGRGMGVKLYTQMCCATTDPLGEQNVIIFLTGPVTGTSIPSTGRYQVITRSPLTGTIFDSSSGGSFGAVMKRAGIDGVIIEGSSQEPVYLFINEEGVEFRSASHLWGKDTHETRRAVLHETSKKASVASIGPAGENLVFLSCIMNDRDRAAGRGGLGAVMGSKRLKAIAVDGGKRVEVADEEMLDGLLARVDRMIDKNPVTGKALQILGTAVLVNVINEHGMFPTENFRRGVFNDAEGISGEKIAESILVKRSGCYRCNIACGRSTRVGNESGEGPEYETAWAFGAQCGINDLEAVTRANYICNRVGMDTISVGSTIGCAMELHDVGALAESVKWGDKDRMLQLVEQTAYKRGFGAEIAMGSKRLAEKYGRGELAMQVKGLELPAYDPRGAQGHALAYATSNRGGCHMRAYLIAPEILGQPVFMDRYSVNGKPELVALLQDISAAVDSLIVCRFIQIALGISTFTEMLNYVTGWNYTDEQLIEVGKRIYTLERKFNCEAGLRRKDDMLPPRFLNEKLEEGSSRDRVVMLNEMLDRYYQLRGWDSEGVPLEETIQKLSL